MTHNGKDNIQDVLGWNLASLLQTLPLPVDQILVTSRTGEKVGQEGARMTNLIHETWNMDVLQITR